MGSWLIKTITSILAKALSIFFEEVEDRIEISLSSGRIRLHSLELKSSALAALDLPVGAIAVSGFLGELIVEVPFRIWSQPVTVHVDRLYLVVNGGLIGPGELNAERIAQEASETMQSRVAAWQILEDERNRHASSARGPAGRTLLDRVVGFAASRLCVAVSNVHVRLQDARESGGEPLMLRVVLRRLALGEAGPLGAAGTRCPVTICVCFCEKNCLFPK